MPGVAARKDAQVHDPIAERQGRRLRLLHELRQQEEGREITYEEIARAIGTSAGAYGHYERGRVRIPLELLPRLARYYRVSVLYLLGLEDEPGLPDSGQLSDQARLVCELVNQMSPETQRLMVTWAADQLRIDRERRASRGAATPV